MAQAAVVAAAPPVLAVGGSQATGMTTTMHSNYDARVAPTETMLYGKYYSPVPHITRKKPVPGRREVDSYRVLMEPHLTKTPAASRQDHFPHNYDTKPPRTELPFIEPKLQYPGITTDNFLNNPQPRKVNFLRENYRFYNTPVAKVTCEKYKNEENQWWKWDRVQPRPDKGSYTLDSTFRDAYQHTGGTRVTPPAGRHTNNPSTNEAAVGIVPVTALRPKGPMLLKEKQSFGHIYDARQPNNYPPFGKRQGAFVWDATAPVPSPYKEEIMKVATTQSANAPAVEQTAE